MAAHSEGNVSDAAGRAREAVLGGFQWVHGHADVWRLFADADRFAAITAGLAQPWRQSRVSVVVGIESRGFLLGGAAAVALNVGFVAVRKGGFSLLPGPKVRTVATEDYRGVAHELTMQAVLGPDHRVLLVDDWAERGGQALGARRLVEECGAEFLGMSLIVDQLPAEVRGQLGRVTSVVLAHELGPSG